MADKTLKYIITGQDNLSSKLGNIAQNATGMSLKSVAAMAAVATALVAVGVKAVSAAASFEKSMTNISTLVDTSRVDIQAMGQDILELSKDMPVAIDDLTSSMYDITSAGIDAADAIGVLEASGKLAVAGLGSVKQATDLTTSAYNAFKKEGLEAAEIADIMFTSVKTGKTTVEQLAQGFGSASAAAAGAGVKLDEFMSATSALTTVGLPASVAYTQLTASMKSLQKPTKEMSALFKKAGISSAEASIESIGLVETLNKVIDAGDGNNEMLISAFGRMEGYKAAVALSTQVNDAFTGSLNDMRDGNNNLDVAFAKQKETFSAQYDILKNKLNVVLTNLGTVILPVLIEVFKIAGIAIDYVVGAFSGLGESAGKQGTLMNEFAGIVGTTFEIVKTLIDSLRQVWDADFLYIQTITKAAGEGIKLVFGGIVNTLKTAMTVINGVLKTGLALLKGDWDGAMTAWSDMTEKTVKINEGWFETMMLATGFMWDDIKASTSQALSDMGMILTAFGDFFSNLWTDLWTGISEVFTNIWRGILKTLENMLNSAIDFINKIIKAVNKIPGMSIPTIGKVSLVAEKETAAVGARQSGGSVLAGSKYLVGERGPEMFVPNQSGSIVANDKLGGGINITITGNNIDSTSRIKELADEIEKRLSRKMQLNQYGVTT